MWDVVIVGAGTAGLSAALVLGRARRRVLLLDGGLPRNAPAHAAQGFFTRDGTSPLELLKIGREQLAPYTSVELRSTTAVEAIPIDGAFEVRLADGAVERGQKLLLAAGVVDELPPIPGLRERWGDSVNSCPYCHGWEARDQPLAVYGSGPMLLHYVRTILTWSRDLVVCTDGADLDDATRRRLADWGVGARHEPIARIDGQDGRFERIVFEAGADLPRSGMFMRPPQRQRSDLAERLGCAITEMHGLCSVKVNDFGETTVAGVFAAGDTRRGMQSITLAAADGAVAAAGINTALAERDDGPT